MDDLAKQVEAVLFASGRYMDSARIAELLEEKPARIKKTLAELQKVFEERDGALRLMQDEDAWKLHVKSDYLDLVSKIISDTEVSGPVLETLAIVAWRSPVLQSEVVNIRGSNAYEHIKELVERGFVVKEPEGRSYRLRITEKFFDYFDIEGRDDIRQVFREVEEAHREKEMELELAQKRLEEAMKRGEEGVEEGEVVDEITGEDLPKGKKVNIDDLDSLLEKSQKTRERVAKEMDELRKKDAPENVEGVEGAEASSDDGADAPLEEKEDK